MRGNEPLQVGRTACFRLVPPSGRAVGNDSDIVVFPDEKGVVFFFSALRFAGVFAADRAGRVPGEEGAVFSLRCNALFFNGLLCLF